MANSTTTRSAQARVQVLPASSFHDRLNQTRDQIARRAYEMFESRGRADGRDIDDWLRAESELLHGIPHTVAETEKNLVVFAQLPPSWRAEDLAIGVESRRLIISGERPMTVTYTDQTGARTENRMQSILRVIELPVDVDPARATAALGQGTLEVVMPRIHA